MEKIFNLRNILILSIFLLISYLVYFKDNKKYLSCDLLKSNTGFFAFDKKIFYWDWDDKKKIWLENISFIKVNKNIFIVDFTNDKTSYGDYDLILKVNMDKPSIEYTNKNDLTIGTVRNCEYISYKLLNNET